MSDFTREPDEGPHARWRLDWQERRLMGRLMRP